MPGLRREGVAGLAAISTPRMRRVHADREDVAQQAVAQLCGEASANVGGARLQALIGELAERGAGFRAWWSSYQVAPWPVRSILTSGSSAGPPARPGSSGHRRLRELSQTPAEAPRRALDAA
ncbi:MmyB family transcriptional regulator [Streptomyces olivaceoviridis]|uniref:MmyB family transcriptional regulator n=1 Tax=Streptomyces olivaceoviridis TaxID=1921 RepID=UPI0036F6C899